MYILDKASSVYHTNRMTADGTEKGMKSDYNQFLEADLIVKAMKKKYPDANISTTGHSLGGANAEYAAAMNDVPCVSYNAPNVQHLLPEDVRRMVEEGYFKHKITSYVHPKDSIVQVRLKVKNI